MFKYYGKYAHLKKNPKYEAVCPMCNSLIGEKDDFWICEGGCGFKIKNIAEGEKLDIHMLMFVQNLFFYKATISKIVSECKKRAEKIRESTNSKI